MGVLLMETTRDMTTRLDEELRQRQGEKLRRRVVRNLVLQSDAAAGTILSAWKWVRETLEGEGFEARELAEYCQVVLDGIDLHLAGHKLLLEIVEAAGLTPEAVGLRDLEAKLPALREARPTVSEILVVATRPPRPVDEKVLAESTAAAERGEFVPLDDAYLARLSACGDF